MDPNPSHLAYVWRGQGGWLCPGRPLSFSSEPGAEGTWRSAEPPHGEGCPFGQAGLLGRAGGRLPVTWATRGATGGRLLLTPLSRPGPLTAGTGFLPSGLGLVVAPAWQLHVPGSGAGHMARCVCGRPVCGIGAPHPIPDSAQTGPRREGDRKSGLEETRWRAEPRGPETWPPSLLCWSGFLISQTLTISPQESQGNSFSPAGQRVGKSPQASESRPAAGAERRRPDAGSSIPPAARWGDQAPSRRAHSWSLCLLWMV